MPLSTNTYGTSTGLERLIGDVVVSRAITATSIPSLTYVEGMLDQTAAELNRELKASGYSVPVSTGDVINRPWLAGVNEYGAAALVLGSMPMAAFASGAAGAGRNRLEMFQGFFNAALLSIRENRVAADRSRGRLGAVFAGSQSDSDGNRKLPSFTRSEGDYPGTVSRTE
jgi:hypothetical protein